MKLHPLLEKCACANGIKDDADLQAVNDALHAADAAVRKTLGRIATEAPMAWYCGHGTEIYSLQCKALAALQGKTVTQIEATWIPCKDSANPAEPKPVRGSYDVAEVREDLGQVREALDRVLGDLQPHQEKKISEVGEDDLPRLLPWFYQIRNEL